MKVYILGGNNPYNTTKKLLDKMNFSLSNKKVFIKTNVHPNKTVSTDVNVIRAILEKLKDCDIIIGGNVGITGRPFKINNYYDLKEEFGVKLLDLDKDDIVIKKVRDPIRYKEFPVAKSSVDAGYVINVAKLKIHSHAKVTMCLKNLFGCIPGRIRLTIHPFIIYAIHDYMQIFRSDLNIIDGIIGNQNDEGIPHPVRSNIMIGGYDALCVDVVGTKCMGVDPEEVEYLKLLNYDTRKIEVIGEKIEDVLRCYSRRKLPMTYIRYFVEDCLRLAIRLNLLSKQSN
jgi:uncharacterized protein (DUF362 family)